MAFSGGSGLRGFVTRSVAIGVLAGAVSAATIPVRPVPINVRWKAGISDAERHELERRFQLTDGRMTEGSTRSYLLTDLDTDNIRALIQHPAVDDTANLHRGRFRPPFTYDRMRVIPVYAALAGVAGAALWAAAPAIVALLRMRVPVPAPVLVGAVAAAPIVLMLAAVIIVAAAAFGGQPLWRSEPFGSLTAAALAGNQVAVRRMVDAGVDLHAAAAVDVRERRITLTPIEAAVLSGDIGTVRMLVEAGSTPGDTARLRCLAAAAGGDEVRTFVAGLPGAGAGGSDCAAMNLPVS
jgi:hypothetical protein